jgi:outer membrane protein assembly factor BamB
MKIKHVLILSLCLIMMTSIVRAQFPHIKWWYDVHDASFGQTASGDIDKDGKPELVFGCYRNDSSIYALNSEDGTLLWKYNAHPAGAEGCNDAAPTIYDVDADDSLEVIVTSSCNPKVFCFNGRTGAIKWQTATHGSDSPPTIGDIDNDGLPEILFGEFGGYVMCLNAQNGSMKWEIAVDLNSWIQTAPTIVDLDNDGQLDFVVGAWARITSDTSKVYAYRGYDHSLMWKFTLSDVIYHGTAVADLDGDSKPELVLGDYSDTLYCLNGENGSLKWHYNMGSYCYVGAPASIADLNNDGDCEIVAIAWYKVSALNNDGTLLWNYNIPGYGQAFRGAALADINGDNKPDVTFATDNGLLISLNGASGDTIFTLNLWAHYGDTLEIEDAPVIINDPDDSSILDIFVVGGYCCYPNFQNNYGRAYMIQSGHGNGPEWPMFQRDIKRTSSMCVYSTGINEQQPTAGDIDINLSPNPSSGEFAINIFLAENSDIEISIYDQMGRLVKVVTKEKAQAGQHIYHCNDLNSTDSQMKAGMYCCRVIMNGSFATKKLIIIK